MTEIKTIYKEQEIRFLQAIEIWRWDHGEYGNSSLKKVEAYIDKALKDEFEQKTALLFTWQGGYSEITVTSIDEEGNYWIKDEKGKRRKEYSNSLFEFSESNKTIIGAIENIDEEILMLNKKIGELRKKLTPFTIKEKP